MYIVIGSGPAAISAAVALAARGLPVSVIDPGITLERERESIRARLAATEPDDWNEADVQRLKRGMHVAGRGIPKKAVFGSDFIFRDQAASTPLELVGASMIRSYSVGGLSNVWGACILPYREGEIADWPIALRDLEPHYRAVLSFMPNSGRDDDLSQWFPRYSDSPNTLRLNSQAQNLLDDLNRHGSAIRSLGIRFGASRLAMRAGTTGEPICRHCGMCLYGCPYDLIYSSASTLRALEAGGKVAHLAGYVVERVEETGNAVTIFARRASDGAPHQFRATKVFLGAGIIESTRVILESSRAYDTPIVARHSDRFVLPFLRYRPALGIMDEKVNTLCQLFLEVNDPAITRENIHLQVYAYNDLFARALENRLGPFRKISRFAVRRVLERLMVMFGYLHSNVSSTLTLELRSAPSKRLVITGRPSAEAALIMRRVARKLASARKYLRGFPAIPSMDLPGGGNHSCGTLPMSATPSGFQTDVLGVPYGFRNLHVVDSSVLPSIGASSITLSVMANAHRIASQCDV